MLNLYKKAKALTIFILLKGFARCKRIHARIHPMDSGFQVLDFGSFVSGTWVPDSNHKWVSGFLELYSGLQSPGFRIPDSTTKNFSGFRNLDSFTWGEKVYPLLGRFLVSFKVLVFVLVS